MSSSAAAQIRVLNVQEAKALVSSGMSTLARGVLPLTQAATEWLAAAGHHGQSQPKDVRVVVSRVHDLLDLVLALAHLRCSNAEG